MLATQVEAGWTKHNGEWAVTVKHGEQVKAGDKVQAIARSGKAREVTLGRKLGENKWSEIWAIAQDKKEPVAEGYYFHAGNVYKVRTSKTGNAYATVLTRDGNKGRWEYEQGAVWKLTAKDAITIQQAAEYGHLHGFCAICGLTLTDPASVERGIGPVCAKKLAPYPPNESWRVAADAKMAEQIAAIRALPKPADVSEGLWQEHIDELIEGVEY